ncbi:glycosyltransferase [Helicobacter sp. 23-1044]
MLPKFYLLGDCAPNNPSAISKEQILRWENEGIIKYLGIFSDVREIIALCDCVILPSFYKEGVPRIMLEALAFKKAIITTNTAGCKECVASPLKESDDFYIGQNGILVPIKNSTALKNAINYLYENPHLLQQMGENGAEFVKKFDIKNIIKIYQKTISNLLPHSAQIAESALDSALHTKIAESNKNLAFISNTCFGMWNFRLPILKSLQNDGYKIHIIAPFDSVSQNLAHCGFTLHNIKIDSKSLNPLKDLKTAMQIYRIVRKIQPAMIFCYTIKCVIYGSFIANMLKIPNIAVITGLGYVFIGDNFKKRILQKIVCKMYQIALLQTKQVWFLNNDDKSEFIKRKIIAESSAFLLNSEGIDLEHFNPNFTPKREVLPPKKKGEIRFVLIARMLWDKGVGEFVEAAKMIKEANIGGGGD